MIYNLRKIETAAGLIDRGEDQFICLAMRRCSKEKQFFLNTYSPEPDSERQDAFFSTHREKVDKTSALEFTYERRQEIRKAADEKDKAHRLIALCFLYEMAKDHNNKKGRKNVKRK